MPRVSEAVNSSDPEKPAFLDLMVSQLFRLKKGGDGGGGVLSPCPHGSGRPAGLPAAPSRPCGLGPGKVALVGATRAGARR